MLPTALDAAQLIEAVGSSSVRLLYDAYHAAMAGVDPMSEAPGLVPLIGHVQYSAVPGRGEPQDGGTQLLAFNAVLRASGYRGSIGLEIQPRSSTDQALSAIGACLSD